MSKSNQKEKSDLASRHILSVELACVEQKIFLLARTEGSHEGQKRKRFRDEDPSKLSLYVKNEGSLAKSESFKEVSPYHVSTSESSVPYSSQENIPRKEARSRKKG